jgi:hypothetical protein
MPRTIAALFDSRADAEGAFHALLEAGVAGHQSALLACREPASSELAPRRTLSPDHDDVRRALRELRLPAPDTAEFEEAVRHGGCLLSARVDAAAAARAVEIIEAFNPVDLDRPAADRRRSDVGTGPGAPLGAGLTAGAGPGLSQTASLPGLAGMAGGADALGSADRRTQEFSRHDAGSSAAATGSRAPEDRAGTPGVNELAYRRDIDRSGRVRVYIRT